MWRKDVADSVRVFISYAHSDKNLAVLLSRRLREHSLNVWFDENLTEGIPYYNEIRKELRQATHVIILWTKSSVKSSWVIAEANEALKEKKLILPLLLEKCELPLPHTDLQSLEIYDLRKQIDRIIRAIGAHSNSVPELPDAPELYHLDALSLSAPTDYLFGREDEMAGLSDAWERKQTKIFLLNAIGGTGKTALVEFWLRQMASRGWRDAEVVYLWSFYNQGTDEKGRSSSEEFFEDALERFGYQGAPIASPSNKGEELGERVGRRRALIILDGLEPLQILTGASWQPGLLKDKALHAFLKRLIVSSRGMCLITSRLELPDFKRDGVIQQKLKPLSENAGAALLRHLGVNGIEDDIQATVRDFEGHALALTLLGHYLTNIHNGDIRCRDRVPPLSSQDFLAGDQAWRVMRRTELHFEERINETGGQDTAAARQLALLYIMGLFDRPVGEPTLNAVISPPAIPGLTESFSKASVEQKRAAIKALSKLGLLHPTLKKDHESLDAHPLVREYFRQRLRTQKTAWRIANERLLDFYKLQAKEEYPSTLKAMEPLFAAIAHACFANRQQEAFDDIYMRRIRRGDQAFIIHQLVGFGEDLAALAQFFDQSWTVPTSELNDECRALVMNFAGFAMRALLRLDEAKELTAASIEFAISEDRWSDASIAAATLTEILIDLGNLDEAFQSAENCCRFAEKAQGDLFLEAVGKARLATVLHQFNRTAEAEKYFQEAEALQAKLDKEQPWLSGLQGFRYCDLMLSKGESEEVYRRASWSHSLSEAENRPVDTALDELSIAQAQSKLLPHRQKIEVAEIFDRAVTRLKDSGRFDHLPRALIARARYNRLVENFTSAISDLKEAMELAERGRLRLNLVDCNLEQAWVMLDKARAVAPIKTRLFSFNRNQNDGASEASNYRRSAQAAAEEAATIIADCKYHRRVSELNALNEQIKKLDSEATQRVRQ